MKYLKDSCVFIDRTQDRDSIINIALHCKHRREKIAISQQIIDELHPGRRLERSVREKGIELQESVQGAINSRLIDLISIEQDRRINDKYKEIRKRFYSWMTNPIYIRNMIDSGKLTIEEVRSKGFKHKDEGECTLIAIALSDPQNYIIITQDKGRVYKKPHENLFDTYAIPNNISVMNYEEWTDYIEYEG